ncbi:MULTISPECIES: hypothetical protein [Ochrobactrum]|uniref:Uncharacterized protein n=1 Tax=Ochrobactrum chromiisoli TaxID=2993941 RepID=A0ABT3QNM4_9HYPH|nr:hypothetical protein [Ochrobactrum chromiisoli]MCX2697218.1 hypothetical protein [Ochrobactrum chromiisoli]
MFTGEIRSIVDQVWNAFWAGGITYAMLRWSRFKNDGPARMFFIVSENVFQSRYGLVHF